MSYTKHNGNTVMPCSLLSIAVTPEHKLSTKGHHDVPPKKNKYKKCNFSLMLDGMSVERYYRILHSLEEEIPHPPPNSTP